MLTGAPDDIEAQFRRIDIEVGARMRLRRLELGVSVRELAAAAGVTYQQLQKYEKGDNRIPVSRMVHLARALKTSVATFLGEGPQMLDEKALHHVDGECTKLLTAWNRIQCTDHRRNLLRLIESLAHNG
ncbi:helix-turn-helix domain-containing protein [Brevundimonas diminuta]|nr:helix-turn-helix transcriptional regulator [Brevundimonas diminuta]MBD3818134.1 helix-turn-helix transcriptional regulator [Brevundimonas diminuta]